MQDKTGFASIAWGLITAVYGAFTLQQWGVIVGILGVIISTSATVWGVRQKARIQREAAQASLEADKEKAGYWRHRRRTDPKPGDEG